MGNLARGNHEPSLSNEEGAETIERVTNRVEYIQVDGSAWPLTERMI
jgi:hypothetical protein